MIDLSAFLQLAAAYGDALSLPETVVSKRALGVSDRLGVLRRGEGDIGLKRLRRASLWLSEQWPEKHEWPAGIVRPVRTPADDEAERARRPRRKRSDARSEPVAAPRSRSRRGDTAVEQRP